MIASSRRMTPADYGRRKNVDDDFELSDNRVQLTFRYNFSADIRGQ